MKLQNALDNLHEGKYDMKNFNGCILLKNGSLLVYTGKNEFIMFTNSETKRIREVLKNG